MNGLLYVKKAFCTKEVSVPQTNLMLSTQSHSNTLGHLPSTQRYFQQSLTYQATRTRFEVIFEKKTSKLQ